MIETALVGIGRWGARLAKAAAASGRVRIACAVSRDGSRHAEWAAETGVPIRGWDEVLDDPSIRAVLIATPHSRHAREVIAAAQAGKHVLVEKPLALSFEDARAAVAACEAARVVLAHGYNRRFSPAFVDMKARIERGEIGTVLHLEGQFSGPSGFALKPGMWRADPAECPAGAMTARGIHPLDCMIHLAGPVASVYAHSGRRVIGVPVDDVTSALLEFDSGATGYIASHHATAEIWRVQAYGPAGWIEMRSETELVVTPKDGPAQVLRLEEADEERAELVSFADAVEGIAPFPVSAAEAVNAVAVVEAMAASSRSGVPARLESAS